MKRLLLRLVLPFLLLVPTRAQGVVPGATWMRYADPVEAGWSAERLAAAEEYWSSLDSAAFMVVEDGVVVVAWGDVGRRYMCHSTRKSFMSGLYGLYVDAGVIDTEKTMAELEIDDEPPLTDQEKTARIEDLLRARSGVYKLAAYEPPQNPKPPRGSYAPGEFWCYNNWDFNTLCTIFEQVTGKRVFEEFGAHFAKPLGMQDFRVRDGYYHYELDKSIHPAYPFRMSARDCARYGLLFLDRGKWGDRRILSAEWIDRSTRSYSKNDTGGYGYMWWTHDDPRVEGLGMYSAQGVGGQMIAVLPGAGLVIVNRTDTYLGKNVGLEDRMSLIGLVLEARPRERPAHPELVALESVPATRAARLEPDRIAAWTGTYPLVSDGESVDVSIRADADDLLLDTPVMGVFGMSPIGDDFFLVEDCETYLHIDAEAHGDRGALVWETVVLRDFADRLDSGDLEGATRVAERSLELFPMSALSHTALAVALSKSGDPGIALELCEAALELDPANTEAIELYEALSAR